MPFKTQPLCVCIYTCFREEGRQSFCLNFHTVLWPVNTGAAGVCDEKFSVGHLGDRNSHTHTPGRQQWVVGSVSVCERALKI